MNKLRALIVNHKWLSGILALIILTSGIFGLYKLFSPSAVSTQMISETVSKGTLITSVSGTGQVLALNQVDLTPKASGQVIGVYAKAGDTIKQGQNLVSLDAGDALKSVRDAKANLESAKISFAKFKQPATELTLMQAENSLIDAKENKLQQEDNLTKAYEDGFNTVSSAFLKLPNLMSEIDDLLYGYGFDASQASIDWYANRARTDKNKEYDNVIQERDQINRAYGSLKKNFDLNFSDYKKTSRLSSNKEINLLINTTYTTTKQLADLIKKYNNYIDGVKSIIESASTTATVPSTVTSQLSTLNTETSTTNSLLSDLLSASTDISNAEKNLVSADRTITEKTLSLADLKDGVDELDLASQQLSLKQKENSLLDAQEKLADYSVRAPFNGVLASFDVSRGDTVSTGTALGTLITTQNLASITLNEIDAAKVKVGQPATITFDAIEDLSITGTVVEVQTLGTVSQGVVSYTIKIGLDIQDERIKPNMSLSANIVVESKTDVLLIPTEALSSKNDKFYVKKIGDNGQAVEAEVEIGLANDTQTEIISGLNEGDTIITQTISLSATTTPSNTSTTNRGPESGTGDMMRMLR